MIQCTVTNLTAVLKGSSYLLRPVCFGIFYKIQHLPVTIVNVISVLFIRFICLIMSTIYSFNLDSISRP